jgi:hypothetical protein
VKIDGGERPDAKECEMAAHRHHRDRGDEQCGYDALTKVLGLQPPIAPALPFGGIGNEPPPR